jgi:hypothetical protein
MTGLEPLLIAGAIMSAMGSVMEGVMGQQSANYEAQGLRMNAKIDEKNAEIVAGTAGRQEEAQRRQARQQTGAQMLALAESGVSNGSTSGDLLIRQNQREMEMGALETRYSGNVEYTSLLNQAAQKRANAKAKKAEGKGMLIGGVLKGGAGLLSSGAFG